MHVARVFPVWMDADYARGAKPMTVITPYLADAED